MNTPCGEGWPDIPGDPGADGWFWLAWPDTATPTAARWSASAGRWVVSHYGCEVGPEDMAHLHLIEPIPEPRRLMPARTTGRGCRTLADILASQPPSDRITLLRAVGLTPSLARAARKAERDAAIAEVVHLYRGVKQSHAIAGLCSDLARYLGGPWRQADQTADLPDDVAPLRRALHRIARLNNGRPICSGTAYAAWAARRPIEPRQGVQGAEA